ncbi:DUF3046 domain-containing protein [Dermacoccaceae bacterium W4C1]
MWQLLEEEFGPGYGRHLAASQSLPELDDRTLEQALAEGVDPRTAWFALCRAMEIPQERWWGRVIPPTRGPGADQS